jgi:putative phosphoesterase
VRIAALYDIHGNLPALEAVLRDVKAIGVDLVVSGGDVVPGPMPSEALTSLLNFDIPVSFIRGNGDREVLALRAGGTAGRFPESMRKSMQWNADGLDDLASAIAGWPAMTRVRAGSLGDVLFCHATHRNDTEIVLRTTPEQPLIPVFQSARADIVVCGHTHMQFDRRLDRLRIVNPGSVGMPYGDPGAYWAMLGPEVSLRRTDYDRVAAAERMRAKRADQAGAFARDNVLQVPSVAQAMEFMRAMEAKQIAAGQAGLGAGDGARL